MPALVLTLACAPSLAQTGQEAQEEPDLHDLEVEEIVVSAPFARAPRETSLPVTVLSGEQLRRAAADTLGETLRDEAGVSTAGFGPGVGHPVIRGQSGGRVSVLQGGISTGDVSQGPDHAEAVAISLAERIEIIRGPATLLYGSGAVGGVVNLIDGRVPEAVPDRLELGVMQSLGSNGSPSKTRVRLDTGLGQLGSGGLVLHFGSFVRSNDDLDIPGAAIDEAGLEALEEHLHPDEEHDEEELDNPPGYIRNSNSEADGTNLGLSFAGRRGFVGLAFSQLQNQYGLPAGSHDHAHEGEEPDPMMPPGSMPDPDEHDDEGEPFVRLYQDTTRYDLRGRLSFDGGWLRELKGALSYTDYGHEEREHHENGDVDTGTTYSNSTLAGRLTLERAPTGSWRGVYGMQLEDSSYNAAGEEAYTPATDIFRLGLFAVERFQSGPLGAEFGLRLDSNSADSPGCDASGTAFSASGSLQYQLSQGANLLVGLSRSSRTPSVDELFSNVLENSDCAHRSEDYEEDASHPRTHTATNLVEFGDPHLPNETSTNLEIGYRHKAGILTGEVSVYRNSMGNYIYLEYEEEEHEEPDPPTGGAPDEHEEEPQHTSYISRDATFTGVEGSLGLRLLQGPNLNVAMRIFGDMVRAELADGNAVPRIPPAKLGLRLDLYQPQWIVQVRATRAFAQDRPGVSELSTPGYNRLSVYGDYHWQLGEGEVKVFAQATNLLDETIRDHTSLVKYYAPAPGRSLMVGLHYNY